MSSEKEKLRTLTCFSCAYRGMSDGTPRRNCCALTNEWGAVERGYSCEYFARLERVRYGGPMDEYPRRDLLSEDYRTAMQWADAGRGIKLGANGRRMYADGASSQTSVYYLVHDTCEMQEIAAQIEAQKRKVPGPKVKIKVSAEERLLRKSLDLPVTKPLRYMQRVLGGYDEKAVIAYEIVETSPISGTPTLLVTLESGEQTRVYAPYFSEMQKPSFERDMAAGAADGGDSSRETTGNPTTTRDPRGEQRSPAINEDTHRRMVEDLTKVICFDVETTGTNKNDDEILKVSVINGRGEVLLDEYVKPKRHQEWSRAQAINGISLEMVEDCPHIDEYVPELNEIFALAEELVGYNIGFDEGFLEEAGVVIPDDCERFDVMTAFVPIFAKQNGNRDGFKKQKLETCAAFYGYESQGSFHDSLEDARATLHCYLKMKGK